MGTLPPSLAQAGTPGLAAVHSAAGAASADKLVASLPDLDVGPPAAERPLVRARREALRRRVFLHIIAETAQHADIIRESLNGAKSMV